MSGLEQAQEAADQAWAESKFKGKAAKRKCPKCFQDWAKKGRKIEEKPPLFPPDYEGNCPVCGSNFSLPFVSF